jgi:hypothetical protein
MFRGKSARGLSGDDAPGFPVLMSSALVIAVPDARTVVSAPTPFELLVSIECCVYGGSCRPHHYDDSVLDTAAPVR